MVAPATRTDPNARRWSRIVQSYVGDGKRISVNGFENAIREIQEATGLEATSVRTRIYERLSKEKVAQPDAAWEEGEALRAAAPWTSGLLSTLASGHYAEATGI